MAQRSRAAAACLPCKANKSRCSDFRPCARCNKLGSTVCKDLQPETLSEIEPRHISTLWKENINSSMASLLADFRTNINPASSFPDDPNLDFLHCGLTDRPQMLEQEATTTADEQVRNLR